MCKGLGNLYPYQPKQTNKQTYKQTNKQKQNKKIMWRYYEVILVKTVKKQTNKQTKMAKFVFWYNIFTGSVAKNS